VPRVIFPFDIQESFTIHHPEKYVGDEILHLFPFQDAAYALQPPAGTARLFELPCRISTKKDDFADGPTGRAATITTIQCDDRETRVELACLVADSWEYLGELVSRLGIAHPEIRRQLTLASVDLAKQTTTEEPSASVEHSAPPPPQVQEWTEVDQRVENAWNNLTKDEKGQRRPGPNLTIPMLRRAAEISAPQAARSLARLRDAGRVEDTVRS
jgi:hypothetical protein